MFEIDKEAFGAFLAEQRKAKGIHKKHWRKNCLSQIKQSANGREGVHLDKDTTSIPR